MDPYMVDEQTFEMLKRDKQHKDLLEIISVLIGALRTPAIDPVLSEAVNRNSQAVTVFLRKITELSQPDQQEVIAAITSLENTLREYMAKEEEEEEDSRPLKWHFDIEHNAEGRIVGVTVTAIN
jgi:hypothetical protein